MKTSALTGVALDWAVAKCEGYRIFKWHACEGNFKGNIKVHGRIGHSYSPSTNWEQGGAIIERERIAVEFLQWDGIDCIMPIWTSYKFGTDFGGQGSTPLISAMRCFVASKLGEEVKIPQELGGRA